MTNMSAFRERNVRVITMERCTNITLFEKKGVTTGKFQLRYFLNVNLLLILLPPIRSFSIKALKRKFNVWSSSSPQINSSRIFFILEHFLNLCWFYLLQSFPLRQLVIRQYLILNTWTRYCGDKHIDCTQP